jgi:hypothetical protein
MEEAKITFYQISKCGLYKYGAEDPTLGKIAGFLEQLKVWVKKGGKPLDETCTYVVDDGEDVDRTFSYEGKVAAVKAKSKVGSAVVEFTTLPKNSIPGYATYFWFVPSKNVYATVRFQHRLNGKRNLDKYIKEFIAKFSDYVVLDDDGNADFTVAGYSEKDGDKTLNLHSQFKSVVVRKPGQIEYIRQNVGKIRKIERHNKLLPQKNESQELWQKALLTLGLKNQPKLKSEVNFSYEFSFTPTDVELVEIVNEWEKNHDSKWDDVGFMLKGEQSPLWLSNSLARDQFDVDVKRIDDEIVDAKSLLDQLTDKRSLILSLLK